MVKIIETEFMVDLEKVFLTDSKCDFISLVGEIKM